MNYGFFFLLLLQLLAQGHGQEYYEIIGFNQENRNQVHRYVISKVGHDGEELVTLPLQYHQIEPGATPILPDTYGSGVKCINSECEQGPEFTTLMLNQSIVYALLTKPLLSTFVTHRYETLIVKLSVISSSQQPIKVGVGFVTEEVIRKYFTKPERIMSRLIDSGRLVELEFSLTDLNGTDIATESYNQLIYFVISFDLIGDSETKVVELSAPKLSRANRGRLLMNGTKEFSPMLFGNCVYESCLKYGEDYCDGREKENARQVIHLAGTSDLLCGFQDATPGEYLFGSYLGEALVMTYSSRGNFRVSLQVGWSMPAQSERIYSAVFPTTNGTLVTAISPRDRFQNNLKKEPIGIDLQWLTFYIDDSDGNDIVITDIYLM